MAKVTIDGQEFTLSAERAQDLMQWLAQNGGVKVESVSSNDFEGQQLLNEKTPAGGKLKPATKLDPHREKQDPNKTWDMGTKWM